MEKGGCLGSEPRLAICVVLMSQLSWRDSGPEESLGWARKGSALCLPC